MRSRSSAWVLNLNLEPRDQCEQPFPSRGHVACSTHRGDAQRAFSSPNTVSAALLHEYIQPETLSLEDGLSVNTGRPWAGSASWKDFLPCLFWRGLDGASLITLIVKVTGRFNYAKTGKEKGVDEKAGICITTHTSGGISVIYLFSSLVLYVRPFSHCEYDNGYLVFDRMSEEKEVWRLASDFSAEGEVATHSPPDVEQMDASACAATVYHQYAPRGQFRPWAVLALPSFTIMYRLAYPTLIFANSRHAFLYDLRTGSLVQTIDLQICYVDVNERYVFVCEPHAVHVFSRESGNEVLEIPADATIRCTLLVHGPTSDTFIKPISVSSKGDQSRASPRLQGRP
ncbi:hypothetical protein EDB85DRAFT_2294341 [Lactarius pseudohatsudake]|nr:hypothetical protein EDB85DRAFT_2294341 [Lactarius pseudohatsudake]